MGLMDKIIKPLQPKYEIVRNPNGKHQIGGDKPTDFEFPENQFISNFQYLGFIDNSDEIFSWLPFKVNLICPIYLDIDKVFLDYQNPNAPTIISPINTKSVTTAYDDLDINSIIVFESVNVSLEQKKKIDEYSTIGIAGKPSWMQSSEIPKCPKSKKPMKFICQLKSFGDVMTSFTNVTAKDEWYNQYFEKMNFWGDGDLYIYFEPTEKTMCYFIQNS